MGLKGKPAKSSSSSVSGSAQEWAKPYATQGAQNILSVYNAEQPQLQALQGNLLGQLSGMQQQGQKLGQVANKASGFQSDVLGGKYLQGNPYIKNMMGQIGEEVLGNVGSAFSGAGRYGSGAYTGVLTDQLTDQYAQLLYGNYATEMDRMMAAAQQAQSAQSANQQQILAGTQLASQVPYQGMTSMANSLGTLFNGGTSNSTSVGAKPGLIDYAMQAASNAASAAAMSDRRVKVNIHKDGEFRDGLGIYTFEYAKGMGLPEGQFRGVMADEVKALRPQAYIENFNGTGYAGVDYARL